MNAYAMPEQELCPPELPALEQARYRNLLAANTLQVRLSIDRVLDGLQRTAIVLSHGHLKPLTCSDLEHLIVDCLDDFDGLIAGLRRESLREDAIAKINKEIDYIAEVTAERYTERGLRA